jgi:multiple sugar transport system permease protein
VRELLVGEPVLRSRDRRTFAYETPVEWMPEAGRATVEEPYRPQEKARVVAYDFGDGASFVLQVLLVAEEGLERVDEVVLPVHADDSWHRLYLTLETAGGVWSSRSPFYLSLGSGGWSEMAWRKPDFVRSRLAYEFFKPMQMSGVGSPLAENEMLLTVRVERSSLGRAVWGKVSRNYEMVFAAMPFGRYLLNSFILVILNCAAAIVSCSLAGYAFARLRWRGRQVYFILMLATMTIPPQVTMVPTFILMRHLGFYNTYMPLVLPSLIATPFFVFLLRQFLMNVPRDLEDAAVMDGCSHFRIYWNIMMPLIRPTLVIVALFTFIATWNDFLGPLIYLSDQRLYPVSLGIFAFQSYAGTVGLGSPAVLMAAATLMVLPVIAVFFFAQRYFTQGIKMSGLK